MIIGTVKSINIKYSRFLNNFEFFSIIIFTVEYVLRVWACVSDKKYSNNIKGRLKFISQPIVIIDLFAFLPFYLPFLGLDLRFIRILRVLRIFRIFKIGRYYQSLNIIKRVIISKKEELVLLLIVMLFLIITSSSIIYYCENAAQPENFPDIPSAMWWAAITITTVGYGDVYPITTLGKIMTTFISILGISMFALPTAVLGAGFIEEINKKKQKIQTCPHCGKKIIN